MLENGIEFTEDDLGDKDIAGIQLKTNVNGLEKIKDFKNGVDFYVDINDRYENDCDGVYYLVFDEDYNYKNQGFRIVGDFPSVQKAIPIYHPLAFTGELLTEDTDRKITYERIPSEGWCYLLGNSYRHNCGVRAFRYKKLLNNQATNGIAGLSGISLFRLVLLVVTTKSARILHNFLLS